LPSGVRGSGAGSRRLEEGLSFVRSLGFAWLRSTGRAGMVDLPNVEARKRRCGLLTRQGNNAKQTDWDVNEENVSEPWRQSTDSLFRRARETTGSARLRHCCGQGWPLHPVRLAGQGAGTLASRGRLPGTTRIAAELETRWRGLGLARRISHPWILVFLAEPPCCVARLED
jgi:hypothetical protein